MKVVKTIFFICIFLNINNISAQEAEIPKNFGYNFLETNNITPDVSTLTTDLFGDQIDPSTGSISFTQTDVDIPGNFNLPVRFTRRLADPESWYKEPLEMGTWSVDIPHVRSSFIRYKGDHKTAYWAIGKACSYALNSNPTFSYGAYMEPGRAIRYEASPKSYWNGDSIYIPGQGSVKITSKNGIKTNNRHWKIACTNNFSGREGFKITLTNGTTYFFNQYREVKSEKKFYATPYIPSNACINCAPPELGEGPGHDPAISYDHFNVFMLATRVEDIHGNWVKYEYNSSGIIDRIHSSDGREIDVVIEANRVKSVVANNKTWTYDYDDTYFPKSLETVTRPDNKSWQFSHNKNANNSLWLRDNVGGHTQTFSPGYSCAAVTTSTLVNITHPEGMIGEFDVAEHCHNQTEVPKIRPFSYNNYSSIFDTYFISPGSVLYSLKSKKLTLTSQTEYEWNYNYSTTDHAFRGEALSSSHRIPQNFSGINSAHLKSSTVIQPDNSKIISYFDRRYRHNGNMLFKEWYDSTGTLLKRESYKYIDGSDPGKTEVETFVSIAQDNWGANDLVSVKPNKQLMTEVKTEMFTSDARTTTYWQKFRSFNAYDVHRETTNYNSFETDALYTKTDFKHDTTNWILNLPTKSYVSDSSSFGSNYKETIYKTGTNLPYQEKLFGRLISTNTYHTDGNLKRTTYNGSSRYEQFDNYYRGKARKITMPCPESGKCNTANGSTSSTVIGKLEVNADGTTKSVTDFSGNKVSYSYNPIGWLELINYSAPQLSSQNINYSNVTTAGDGKSYSGISVGMLKQTITHGGYEKSIYLDSLLRPVLTRTRDKNKTGSDVFLRNRFDHANRATFQSFPSDTSTASRGYNTTYDGLGRKFNEVRTTDNATTRYRYLSGNRLSVSDAKQNQTITTFRAFGSPSQSKATFIDSPEGVDTTIDYNLFGQVRSISQGGKTETRLYDSRQQLCKVSRPETGLTAFGYNEARQIAWQAEGTHGNSTSCGATSVPSSHKTVLTYNNWGDVKVENYSDGSPDRRYHYNENGLLKTLTTGTTTSWNYLYNSLGLVDKQTLSIDNKTFVIDPAYNSLGHLSQLTYPTGRVVDFSPNALGQPTKAATYAKNATYHANGSLDTFTYGNNLTYKQVLNNEQLPYELRIMTGSRYKSRNRYLYDDNNNVDYIYDLTDRTYDIDLGYDDLNRLNKANGKWGTGSFTYDDMGNLLTKNLGSQRLTYSYDTVKNRLKSVSGAVSYTLGYDARGNVSNNGRYGLIFNRAGQLTNAKGNSYTYDGHNRLVKKVANGKTSYSVYGLDGTLYHRIDADGKKVDYIRLGKELVAKDNGPVAVAPPSVPPLTSVPTLSGYAVDAYNLGYTYRLSWQYANHANVSYYQVVSNGVGSGKGSGGIIPDISVNKSLAKTLIKIDNEWTQIYQGTAKQTAKTINANSVGFKIRACNAKGCTPYSAVVTIDAASSIFF